MSVGKGVHLLNIILHSQWLPAALVCKITLLSSSFLHRLGRSLRPLAKKHDREEKRGLLNNFCGWFHVTAQLIPSERYPLCIPCKSAERMISY